MGATKVAIATDGDRVSAHFGRCEGYVVAEVEDGQVVSRRRMANPGHERGRLPKLMEELGVDCLITGGIGPRAVEMLARSGIHVLAGVSGSVDQVLADFVAGRLKGSENACEH
ncbi:MAG: NifB/NifX family molybdenum-iron cluster-binding protein [Armatimonadetes bacterium]|nr:NifB/NifX family molybdenum-iron cluster-binding protein [Armatimonadota bacterium]